MKLIREPENQLMVYAMSGFPPESVYDAMGAREADDEPEVEPGIDYLAPREIEQLALQGEQGITGPEITSGLVLALREALKAIPQEHRTVIDRIYFAGKTVGNVAQELGMPYQKVEEIRESAIEALRVELDQSD